MLHLFTLPGLAPIAEGIKRADPITLVATLLTSLAPSIFGATVIGSITVGTLVAGLVVIAIGVGLSMLLTPKAKVQTPENGTMAVQQALPYRIFAYGTARIAGAVMLKEERAGQLVVVNALCAHEIDQFTGLYLNDDLVTVPLSGGLLTGAVGGGTDGRYAGYVSIDSRKGHATETPYAGVRGLLSDIWPATARGDGIASLSMILSAPPSQKYTTIFPYGASQASPVGQWCKIFDPRDVTQSVADPTTWKFSKNAALQILHYECFSPFGAGRDYSVAIAPVLDMWIAAANACDDAMPLKVGGSEPRYQAGGWNTTDVGRKAVLEQLLAACDGWYCQRGDGASLLQVGKFVSPTVVITDDDIVGFFIQSDLADGDKVNQITASWTSPDCAFASVETDPLVNTTDRQARVGAPRKARLDLTWVQENGQASRLLKREFIRQMARVRGRLDIRLSGLNAAYTRWFIVQSNSIPRLSNAVLENRKPNISISKGIVSIEFVAIGAEIDVYDPAVDESSPPSVPQRPTTVGLPIPANVNVTPEELLDASGAVSVILSISWDQPLYNGNPWTGLAYAGQYRLHDVGGGVPGDWVPMSFPNAAVSAGRVSVQTGVVPVGTSLDVQVASVSTGASLSTYSPIETVSTAIATSAPTSPIWISAVGGSGVVDLSASNPNSPNFSYLRFYRGASGDPFTAATAIGTKIFGAPNGTSFLTDTVTAGTYDYWAVAFNSSDVGSAAAGPETGTAT